MKEHLAPALAHLSAFSFPVMSLCPGSYNRFTVLVITRVLRVIWQSHTITEEYLWLSKPRSAALVTEFPLNSSIYIPPQTFGQSNYFLLRYSCKLCLSYIVTLRGFDTINTWPSILGGFRLTMYQVSALLILLGLPLGYLFLSTQVSQDQLPWTTVSTSFKGYIFTESHQFWHVHRPDGIASYSHVTSSSLPHLPPSYKNV